MNKKVKVDFTIHTVMEVPEDWDEDDIDWHFNYSSWCASNLISILDTRDDAGKCMCDITEAKYVGDASLEDIDKWGV